MFCKNIFQKNFILASLTFMCAIFFALTTMITVYSIPNTLIRKNVQYSLKLYQVEGKWYKWAVPYHSSQLEGFGDAYLLSKALFPVKDILKDSMLGPYYLSEKSDHPVVALFDYFSTEEQSKIFRFNSARYWSGSLILLKPLLTVFNLSEIRLINMVIQIFLLCLLVIQLYLRGGYKLLIPFLVGIFILNPISCALSISYTCLYYITLVSCLILLKYKLYESKKYWYFFFIIGITTIFFDQFTFTLISLGFPLILWVLLNNEAVLPKLKKVIIATICWGIGFLGMWLGKWIIASLITKENVFKEVLNQSKMRIGSEIWGYHISAEDVIHLNMKSLFYCLPPYFYLFLIGGIVIYFILCHHHTACRMKLKKSLFYPLILISVYPFVYCLILKNASYVHHWMFYRMFSLTVVAFTYIIVYAFEKGSYKNSTKSVPDNLRENK